MTRKSSRKTRSVSSRENKIRTIQVIDNRLGPHDMCNVSVVTTPMDVFEWVQIISKKGRSALQTVAENLKTGHSDRLFVFHSVKKSEGPEHILLRKLS